MNNIYLDVKIDESGNPVNVKEYNTARKTKNPWIIWYHANWCGHCIGMKDSWEEFVRENRNKLNIAKIEESALKFVKSDGELLGFPTIKLIDNNLITEYQGDRTAKSLLQFVDSNSKSKSKSKSNSKSKSKSKSKNNSKSGNNIKRKRTHKKKKHGKKSRKNNVTGGGILDSIENQLQSLENMLGTYSFD